MCRLFSFLGLNSHFLNLRRCSRGSRIDFGAEHDTENDTENDTEKTIISLIKSNPYVSQEALAKLCNKSRITISRIIKKSNKIKRVGLIKVVIGKS